MTITATYSPEDDKLRLYASARLDADTYARVKGAGYSWAPKQDCFFAVWTPRREDVAEELAGVIDDEDRSLMDRAEERSERFDGYSGRRMSEAEGAQRAVDAVAQRFEGGQPILVGHHSEKRARKDAEKIENGMRRAVNLWRTSRYWEERAASCIRHAKRKERPDVRARRIKGLEADERKHRRDKTKAEMELEAWSVPGLTIEQARRLANYCNLTVAKSDDALRCWSAWDVLRPEEERYEGCPSMTVENVQEAAKWAYPKTIEWCDRWLVHLACRLAYERAMLAESGYQPPPKKTSSAALPLLNYGGTVSYRNRWRDGEIVTGEATGITKAQLAAIHSDYKGTEVSACGTHRIRTAMHVPGHGHSLCVVYLTDSKQHPRPTAAQVEAKAAEEQKEREERADSRARRLIAHNEERIAKEPDPRSEGFRVLETALEVGVEVVAAPQLFPTPPEIAERMVNRADIRDGHRVLEPSAGTGSLIAAIQAAGPREVVAVEINIALADRLYKMTRQGVRTCDFLACNGDLGTFDRIVMNPPFADGADIKHIQHARNFLKPGGVLVALCANGPRQRAALRDRAESWEDLPPGSFKGAGTGVNVALLVIRA